MGSKPAPVCTAYTKSIAAIPLRDQAKTLRLSLMVDVAYPHQNA
jgi:hypothetical protein